MAHLILVRHGESLWNGIGLWTGLTDISLNEKGKEQSRQSAESIKKLNVKIDIIYISILKRAKETLDEIKKVLFLENIPTFQSQALNERDYGIYTGKNKWEIQKVVGNEQFQKIRRGWDVPIKNGESLKDVYNRVVPYYESEILPKLKEGKNVLIVAHGNSLRALVKHLENMSDADVENLEISVGATLIFDIDKKGIAAKCAEDEIHR